MLRSGPFKICTKHELPKDPVYTHYLKNFQWSVCVEHRGQGLASPLCILLKTPLAPACTDGLSHVTPQTFQALQSRDCSDRRVANDVKPQEWKTLSGELPGGLRIPSTGSSEWCLCPACELPG